MDRFVLQKSKEDPLWWVLTDTQAQIVCRFKEGEFNETQQFTPLHDIDSYDVAQLPTIANEMADWLRENHYEIIFDSPQTIVAEARAMVGSKLRELREAKGWTLRDLAKRTGIAFNHIGRIEQGKYNVTIDTIALIAHALGVEIRI